MTILGKVMMNSPTIRSFIWRLGRKLYRWARRENSSEPCTNGEYWLLAQVIAEDSTNAPVLMDIGAHLGNWTERATSLLQSSNIAGHVHAFEPTSSSFAYLSERFKGNDRIRTNKIALSDQSGEGVLFVVGNLVGTNSLLRIDGSLTENVVTLRFDEYMAERNINHVLFVKCDAEGYDLKILTGAKETLRHGQVDVWQFEYNHRWIDGGSFLKDVFDFIADKPYQVGKLYGNGIEIYDKWHPELDRFFESNYVLVRKGSRIEKLCTQVYFNYRNVLMTDKFRD
jgi:FkbM family methyltransferase